MKNLSIALCMFILFSCNKEKGHDLINSGDRGFSMDISRSQKWKLVRMTGNFQNSETTGGNMAWQEHYTFNPDGTFTKFRTQREVSTTASGTYSYSNSSNEKYLILTYSTSSNIIGNCTSDLKETLMLEKGQLYNTWLACDGPSLHYSKVD